MASVPHGLATRLSYSFCGKHNQSGAAVENRNTDLNFRNLQIVFPCHHEWIKKSLTRLISCSTQPQPCATFHRHQMVSPNISQPVAPLFQDRVQTKSATTFDVSAFYVKRAGSRLRRLWGE